jgi:succinate dehydrogenase / fumarate reductase iron-sulfur subunit
MMRRTFRIWRTDPENPTRGEFRNYEVEVKEAWTVLDALNEIKWHQDGSLGYRRSCRHGICGSCAMTIDGKNDLACELQVSACRGNVITVEPLRSFPVLRDLIVDQTDFFARYDSIKPWLICHKASPTDKERFQSPEDRALIDGTWECILCGSCTSSCPVYWSSPQFLGPAAILKAYRYVFDTRDEGLEDRLQMLDNKHGLWRCHTIFNCVEACPKALNPTEAIVKLRRKVVAEKI